MSDDDVPPRTAWSTTKLVVELLFAIGLLVIGGGLVQYGLTHPSRDSLAEVVIGALVVIAVTRTVAKKGR